MPMIHANGTDLYVADTGAPRQPAGSGSGSASDATPGATPVSEPLPIVFLHGFLFDGRMFDAQVAALRHRYRCITLDFRGQGRSARPRHGYQTECHYADVLSVLRTLEIDRAHFVGLSMGGFVSMRLAARHPRTVASLTLVNTSAERQSHGKAPKQLALSAVARALTLRPLLGQIEQTMFGGAFRADPETEQVRREWRTRWLASDRAALIRTLYGNLARPSVLHEIASVACPTLVIGGTEDRGLDPQDSRRIAQAIPGARFVMLDGVGHSAPIEVPDVITGAVRGHVAAASSLPSRGP